MDIYPDRSAVPGDINNTSHLFINMSGRGLARTSTKSAHLCADFINYFAELKSFY